MKKSVRAKPMTSLSTGALTTGGNPYSLDAAILGQGQLARQMKEGLLKKAQLFAPGTTIANVLYSDKDNSAKHMLTVSAHVPSRLESLSSTRFSSSGNVTISNRYPFHKLALHLQLPQVPPDVYLHRGWGYSAIRRITYGFGASSGSNRQVTSEQIKHKLILSARTREQLDYIIRLGGDEVIQGQATGSLNNAIILLGIPGSSISGEQYQVPVPTNVFSGSFTISIEFASLRELATGVGVDTWNIDSFSKAGVYLREYVPELSDAIPSASQMSPEASVIYPFVYSDHVSRTVNIVTLGDEQTLELAVPSKGDLVGISMAVLPLNRYSSISSSLNPVNPWNYATIYDYKITQGSIDLDASPENTRLNEMINTSDGTSGAFNFVVSELSGTYQGLEPAYTTPVHKTLTYWNNSIQRAQLNESVSYNTPDYGQVSLTLSFRADVTGQCTVHIVYHYTAFINFQNGVARLMLSQV